MRHIFDAKPDKGITRNKNYRQIFFINIDVKSSESIISNSFIYRKDNTSQLSEVYSVNANLVNIWGKKHNITH